MKKRVVFLCTGNSCRSQMAEGFARYYGSEVMEVFSAGISPSGINQRAAEVMKEEGIDISGHSSDPVDMELVNNADLLVTLCGNARESCPAVPASVKKIHWDLEDPTAASGSEEEIMEKFRETRDKIKTLVKSLVDELN